MVLRQYKYLHAGIHYHESAGKMQSSGFFFWAVSNSWHWYTVVREINCICFTIYLVFNMLSAYWPLVVYNK